MGGQGVEITHSTAPDDKAPSTHYKPSSCAFFPPCAALLHQPSFKALETNTPGKPRAACSGRGDDCQEQSHLQKMEQCPISSLVPSWNTSVSRSYLEKAGTARSSEGRKREGRSMIFVIWKETAFYPHTKSNLIQGCAVTPSKRKQILREAQEHPLGR